MNVLQSLKRAIASKKPTPSVEFAKLVAQAASERDQSRQRLAALREGDAAAALSDEAWSANGAAIAEAEREVLRLDHVVASLQERLAVTKADEEAADRKRRYAEADARATQVAASIDGPLAKIASETQSLLRDVATTQRDIDAVNADLPDGAEYLAGVELRGRSVPQKPFRSERRKVKAWVEVSSGHVRGREVPGLQVDPDDPTIGYVSGSGRKKKSQVFKVPPSAEANARDFTLGSNGFSRVGKSQPKGNRGYMSDWDTRRVAQVPTGLNAPRPDQIMKPELSPEHYRIGIPQATPQVDATSIDAAKTKAEETGAGIKAALDVTAKPSVDTSELTKTLGIAQQINAELGKTGSLAQAAGRAARDALAQKLRGVHADPGIEAR